jgi:hypothetical protein
MRTTLAILVALATASVVSPAPAGAREYPWCAQLYGGAGGDAGRVCGYVSWAQCRATTGLQDGFCLPNPGYHAVNEQPPSRRRKHRQGPWS